LIDGSMIHEKLEDLLMLEARASELYKETLDCSEPLKYRCTLTGVMCHELDHFRQVQSTRMELAFYKKLVVAQGGIITVQSKAGVGTSFRINIMLTKR
jgi:hypothetical protein